MKDNTYIYIPNMIGYSIEEMKQKFKEYTINIQMDTILLKNKMLDQVDTRKISWSKYREVNKCS
ncbi:hypothetical protein SAMN05421676_105194 [Salinibacillus kushneri]|uniref:Uncharacterized protein n=1 Tax=Salinibacillus kushneri TaxID=237682 RepID=A0A1I0F4N3_9BACI|nr:hypothetical protein [Salinibacillus kushneri]SET52809.1 hypothetical protein SAMN05421676_105194 [Salinibacillus kushneri]